MEKNLKLYEKNSFIDSFSDKEDEIDLYKIFYDTKILLMKNKRLIIKIFLAINVMCFIVGNIVTRSSRVIRTVVQLDYDGAAEGENFDGTIFDKEGLVNGSVLRNLYKTYKLGDEFGNNIDNLKQAISVEAVIPSDIKYISDIKLKAGEKYKYTPMQYIISFKYGDEKQGKNFLEKLVSQSNEKYKNKYLPYQGIGKINFNERQKEEYDYYDHIDVFNAKLSQIQSKINFLKEKNYQSKTSRWSYSDLQSEFNKLKDLEISSYCAEIQVKKISKNPLITKVNYENKIRLAELEKIKLKDRAVAIAEVIKSYKPTEKQVIITGVTENIRLNKIDDYYSNLVNSYKDAIITITEIDSKIREYKASMNELRIPSLEEEKKIRKNEVIIIENINRLVEDTEEMIKSYYEEKYNKFIDVIVPVHAEASGKGKLIVLSGLILGLMIAIIIAYIKEFTINMMPEINKK